MNNLFNIGFFGDDIWAHNVLKLLISDKSIKICFICSRLITKDKKLKKIADKKKCSNVGLLNQNQLSLLRKLSSLRWMVSIFHPIHS